MDAYGDPPARLRLAGRTSPAATANEAWSDTYLKCLSQSARMWRESRAALAAGVVEQ